MSYPPVVPLPGDDDDVAGREDQATRETDGDEVLDPDASDDLIDSADADRIAAGGDEA